MTSYILEEIRYIRTKYLCIFSCCVKNWLVCNKTSQSLLENIELIFQNLITLRIDSYKSFLLKRIALKQLRIAI